MAAEPAYVQDAEEGLRLFPAQASSFAREMDLLLLALTAITLLVLLSITALILYYVWRYREGSTAPRPEKRPRIGGYRLELSWSLATLMIFLVLFVWSTSLYLRMYGEPDMPAMTINVIAKQWMWKTYHPSGAREINELHVPSGEAIKLRLISQDVIHSFSVPAFRIKRDVLPGRYNTAWFKAVTPGVYSLFCAEYCGTEHSHMRGRVVVLAADDYADWLTGEAIEATPAERGRELFRSAGCTGCHSDQAAVRAPTLGGLYGRTVPLADGSTVIADEVYLRDSMLLPRKQIVAGYQPLMPSYEGRLTEAEVLSLIAYLKHLGDDTEADRPEGAP